MLFQLTAGSAALIFAHHSIALPWASSTCRPFLDMSSRTQSSHLRLVLPLPLFPVIVSFMALFAGLSSFILSTWPNHRSLISRTFSDITHSQLSSYIVASYFILERNSFYPSQHSHLCCFIVVFLPFLVVQSSDPYSRTGRTTTFFCRF